jgi:hypothetical protein
MENIFILGASVTQQACMSNVESSRNLVTEYPVFIIARDQASAVSQQYLASISFRGIGIPENGVQ